MIQRKTAKELMADSFKELAHKKNIEKITVKDVVENCGYSPATFYRHFRDKYDLIAWDYSDAGAIASFRGDSLRSVSPQADLLRRRRG